MLVKLLSLLLMLIVPGGLLVGVGKLGRRWWRRRQVKWAIRLAIEARNKARMGAAFGDAPPLLLGDDRSPRRRGR